MTQTRSRSISDTRAVAVSHTRTPAWLLTATLPAYILFVIVSVTTLRPKVEISAAELTPAQIADMPLAWVALTVTWMVPPVLAAIALAMLARQLGTGGRLRVVPILSTVALVLAVVNIVANLAAFQVDTRTWGDSSLFTTGVLSSLFVGWFGVHPATLLILWALFKAGAPRRTALVVGVAYCLYWAFELLVYLPALFQPESLAEVAGLPPFLLGVFWAAIGGALLSARVPSDS